MWQIKDGCRFFAAPATKRLNLSALPLNLGWSYWLAGLRKCDPSALPECPKLAQRSLAASALLSWNTQDHHAARKPKWATRKDEMLSQPPRLQPPSLGRCTHAWRSHVSQSQNSLAQNCLAEPSQPKEPWDSTTKSVLSHKFWSGFLKEKRLLEQEGKVNVIIFHNPSCTVIS